MAEKRLSTRIVHKHATEADWLKATNFAPMAGELIIYDVDAQHTYERVKIGDGTTNVNALPFVDDALRTALNAVDDKIDALDVLVGDTAVATQISNAVAKKADATHTHDDRYYTETEIDGKLIGKSDTTHTHSAYVNQNAFSNVKVGDVTVAADSATDTITLVAGSNIAITPDATNDKITISATDTVYTHPNSGVAAGTYKSVTVNAQGHVTGGSNPTTLSGYGITDAAAKSHGHDNATASAAGFMSAADKEALDDVVKLVGDTSVAVQISEAIASKSDADHTHTATQVGADPSGSAASALTSAKSYTDTKISALINGAPTTLDTLGEIATAMAENDDIVAALEAAIGTKANSSDITSHTGNKSNPHNVTLTQLGVTATAAELNYVDGVTSNVQTQLNAKVPTSRTVNGKALSSNITLSASDVGADASGAANTALANAKSYTDTQLGVMVGDTTVSEQIANSQIVYVGPTQPTDPNIQVWINTAEEGTSVVHVLPRIATITLKANSWSGSAAPYSQTVTIATVTSATKVDLQPTVAQMTSLQQNDIALMAQNSNGSVTVYAFGGKPSADMTMQVQLTEVAYV